MSTDRRRIEVNGITVEVVRKGIKNLHVGVYPPEGRVRVAAPSGLSDDAVRLAVVSRLGWIRRQKAAFEQQDRQSQRELVGGESHYFRGRRYLLDVVEHEGPPAVRLVSNTKLELRVPPGASREVRDAVLQRWYRSRLRELLPALLAKWEPKMGRSVAELRIKRMKTRWGSCNAEARRIWLNSELSKKSACCLEYILLHEMVHLIEHKHTKRFRELMDRLMPSWPLRRDELNRAPLAHDDWGY